MQSRLVGRKTTVVVGVFYFSFLNHNSDGFLVKREQKIITTLLSTRCLEEYKIQQVMITPGIYLYKSHAIIRRWSSSDCSYICLERKQHINKKNSANRIQNRCLNISLGIVNKL